MKTRKIPIGIADFKKLIEQRSRSLIRKSAFFMKTAYVPGSPGKPGVNA